MKVDYDKFPDIPPGYSTNYNKTRDVYQVYRDCRVTDPTTGKKINKRETIGQIKDGKFSYSKLYLARQENMRLEQQLLGSTDKSEATARSVAEKVAEAVKDSKLDQRQATKVVFPIEPIVLAALVSAMTGDTDCSAITQLLNEHVDFFRKLYPSMPTEPLTHDTVYRALLKVKAEKFDAFYQRIIQAFVTKTGGKVLAADGQACRATGRRKSSDDSRHAYMLMNFYDTTGRVCLLQMLIAEKTNEITVAPQMIEGLDIRDCVITADAMNCQWNFAEKILEKGADYCLALKSNQDRASKEVIRLFATTHPDQIDEYTDQTDLEHNRIEERTISLIGGYLLSEPLRAKWKGLEAGCVVRVRSHTTFKSTGEMTAEDRYYLCSLPADKRSAQRVGGIIRAHWGVENRLHWMLDIHFNQDRMQATDIDYISNRVALNKLALALVENYRYWLWLHGKTESVMSTRATMRYCRNFDNALHCLACSQGLV